MLVVMTKQHSGVVWLWKGEVIIMGLGERTIRDFGEQWTYFTRHAGYLGSVDLLCDIIEPLLTLDDIRDRHIAEIDSGAGRVVGMLLEAGADHVTAIEPSHSCEVIREKFKGDSRVTIMQTAGEEFCAESEYDLVLSLGVLYHIPDPSGAVRAAYRSLKPGGRFCVWLYAWEGNEIYLALVNPIRRVTIIMPHGMLMAVVRVLNAATLLYGKLCRYMRLPMREYFLEYFNKLDAESRRATIYDQLNPAYARYYRKEEVVKLMVCGEFKDISLHYRHGYSWTAVGTK